MGLTGFASFFLILTGKLEVLVNFFFLIGIPEASGVAGNVLIPEGLGFASALNFKEQLQIFRRFVGKGLFRMFGVIF